MCFFLVLILSRPLICSHSTLKGFIINYSHLKEEREKSLILRQASIISNGILFQKLFWPTLRKNCSDEWENVCQFEAESWEFEKKLQSLEQFIQTVKWSVRTIFETECFLLKSVHFFKQRFEQSSVWHNLVVCTFCWFSS